MNKEFTKKKCVSVIAFHSFTHKNYANIIQKTFYLQFFLLFTTFFSNIQKHKIRILIYILFNASLQLMKN